jgi:ABC-type antimicrobial peptide transport system permease subunit
VDGEQVRSAEDLPIATAYKVDEHYFPLMETVILRGRPIDARDTASSPRVVVINETMAKKLFGDKDPLGRQIRLDKKDGPLVQVVGVAKNGLYFYWAEPPQNAMWTPSSQDYSSQMYVELRTSGNPESYAAAIREQVRSLDPNMPIFRVSGMESYYDARALLGPRLIAQIVTTTGIMGLFMAVIGLYGVVAYTVSRRTREFGIRMAIGATPRGILRMVLAQGAVFTVIGLALGFLLMIPIASRALPNFITGTSAFSPLALIGVPVILASAMMVACFVPARRAARTDPNRALRLE